MAFRIKNWKLSLLALIFFLLFIQLGHWQLQRAHEKRLLLASFTERTKAPPLTATSIRLQQDWRFYRAQLIGEFDNQHSFLLDNKTQDGQVGYEVYTPFYGQNLVEPLLIDRGFVPSGQNRQQLPVIQPIAGRVILVGMLNLPPHYVHFGLWSYTPTTVWPQRIEYLDLDKMAELLSVVTGKPQLLSPYLLTLAPGQPGAYAVRWAIVTMAPERHVGYAIQWFAFAGVLLILFVALNRNRSTHR